MPDMTNATPATVDAADLLALIRRGINDPGSVLPRETVNLSDGTGVYDERIGAWGARAVLHLLTAAGWTPAHPDDTPGQVEPDDAKPQPVDLAGQLAASLRQAKIDRLTRELTEAHAVIDRQAQVERTIRAERDDARAMVDGNQFGRHWARLVKGLKERGESSKLVSLDHAVTYALAAIDRLKVEASNYAHDRDEARRERDAISAEFDAAQTALIAQRDAERDRADQLAREAEHMTRKRDEAWTALCDLRAGVEAEAATCDAEDERLSRSGVFTFRRTAKRLRALLDGPTTAPNTTQSQDPASADGQGTTAPQEATRRAQPDPVATRCTVQLGIGDTVHIAGLSGPHHVAGIGYDETGYVLFVNPAPNTTQPLYVDHEGKPTGEPRIEVTANVHIVPASPASSPTGDQPTETAASLVESVDDIPRLLAELERLRRVNGEWGQVMTVLIDGLNERGITLKLGERYTAGALREIDRLRAGVERMRPVVNAALEWAGQFSRPIMGLPRRDALVAAVDLYRSTGDALLDRDTTVEATADDHA